MVSTIKCISYISNFTDFKKINIFRKSCMETFLRKFSPDKNISIYGQRAIIHLISLVTLSVTSLVIITIITWTML